MTPTIRIDDDVYDFLKARAEPFTDTPNAVLRRLLDLPHRDDLESEGEAVQDESSVAEVVTSPPAATHRRRRSTGAKRGQRAPRGSLLPQEEYELPILEILAEKEKGWAPSHDVLTALGKRIDSKLTDVDRGKTNSGSTRWSNRAQFARLALVQKGDLVADSPRGVWELTEQGAQRARNGDSS